MPVSDVAPKTPARTRILRPDTFTDEVTGTLAPATLLAYLGLSTRADDAGFLLWRPAALAATIMPYASAGRRQRDLERIGEELVAAGLLRIFDCRCAEMPRMVRDLAIKGGSKTTSVRDWHLAHSPTDSSIQVQIPAAESVPVYGSVSSSSSPSVPGLGPAPVDGVESAPGFGTGRASTWNDTGWLDELHRLGMPFDRTLDQAWLVWLTALRRVHDDRTIREEIGRVVAGGERRPQIVRELVNVALEQRRCLPPSATALAGRPGTEAGSVGALLS